MSKFEEEFVTFFTEKKLIFTRNDRGLTGTPDFSFDNGSIVLFLHGCFWHGHNCADRNLDKIWLSKINSTIKKDFLVRQSFLASDVRFLRVWECDFVANKCKVFAKIHNEITSQQLRSCIAKKDQKVLEKTLLHID